MGPIGSERFQSPERDSVSQQYPSPGSGSQSQRISTRRVDPPDDPAVAQLVIGRWRRRWIAREEGDHGFGAMQVLLDRRRPEDIRMQEPA